jgi:hypothetical protein
MPHVVLVYNSVGAGGRNRRLLDARHPVESLGIRTRAMDRKLRDIEVLPDGSSQLAIGHRTTTSSTQSGYDRDLAEELAETPSP